MTRDERERLLAKLRADSAELREDLARREARTLAGLDPVEHRRSPPPKIITKEYTGPQPGLPTFTSVPQARMTPEQQEPWDKWFFASFVKTFDDICVDAIGEALSDMRRELRQERQSAVADLVARLDELEARVAALEAEDGYQG
jgi:hypothetical protein